MAEVKEEETDEIKKPPAPCKPYRRKPLPLTLHHGNVSSESQCDANDISSIADANKTNSLEATSTKKG
jgi:hypothetical protein